MDQLERFERDYQMGRLAGMSEALGFITSATENLSSAERALISDRVWGPLYKELQRLRRRSVAGPVAVGALTPTPGPGPATVPLPRVDRAGVPSDPARSDGGG